MKIIHSVFYTIILLLFCLMHSTAYAIVAGGMATINRAWPATSQGFNDMEFTITITAEPGYNGRTYWAHQWGFSGSQEGGYAGLQSRNANEKALNFSIWGATAWQEATGSQCAFFGHEGSGVQCWINYPWKEGITYRIKVAKSGSNGWMATITDTTTAITTTVATIQVPASYGGLSRLSEWVENFAQGNEQPSTCAQVPRTIAVYGIPKANGGTVLPTSSSTYTYGDCAAIAKSVCTAEQVCTLSDNVGIPVADRQLKNDANGYCLDLLGGGAIAGLWHCAVNSNQVFSQDETYRFHQANQPTRCLTVNSNSRVVTDICNNSAKQQWLKVDSTRVYFNAGTGLCMDALGDGVLNAPIQVFQCIGNEYQRWITVP